LQAHKRGIIDEQNSSFYNTATGRRMTLDEAIDVGLLFVEFEKSAPGSSPPPCETKTYAVSAVVDQVRNHAADLGRGALQF
jgi:hypothetical protein